MFEKIKLFKIAYRCQFLLPKKTIYFGKKNEKYRFSGTNIGDSLHPIPFIFLQKKDKIFITDELILVKSDGWAKKDVLESKEYFVSIYKSNFNKFLNKNLLSSKLPYQCSKLLKVNKKNKVIIFEKLINNQTALSSFEIAVAILNSQKRQLFTENRDGIIYGYQHGDLCQSNFYIDETSTIKCFDLDTICFRNIFYDFFRYCLDKNLLNDYLTGKFNSIIQNLLNFYNLQFNEKTLDLYLSDFIKTNPWNNILKKANVITPNFPESLAAIKNWAI